MKQSLTKLFKKMEVGKEGIKEIRTESHFDKKKVKENVAPFCVKVFWEEKQ